MTYSEIVSFLWNVADLIRDTFKRGKYQDIILPLTVLRRLDYVLAPTKAKVLAKHAELKEKKLENVDKLLCRASGYAFYNTSKFDFERLTADSSNVARNLRNYIAGFSQNMREVIEKFDFDNTISKLDEAGLLFQVLQRFKEAELHPKDVDNATMGTIFEELIRKFNESLDENPGEHFTPRDVVHLMVDLMLAGDEKRLRGKGLIRTVYDPCCGTGGMLTVAKEHIAEGISKELVLLKEPINPDVDVHLFGQEVNPETFAICKSDLFMKSGSGEEANRILFGSTLSNDRHEEHKFDYQIANPPYGKDWKRDEKSVRAEHDRGTSGRFGAGLPRISDGQILFLQHMIHHMRPVKDGGARGVIIMNGSPLFTGDAGSGESEIRRWVLEHDYLEALIALPEQMFYNTGISTYVWVLTNRKAPERKGKVQLIDASSFWTSMRKSLGSKRREIPFEKAQDLLRLHSGFKDGEARLVKKDKVEEDTVVSKVFPTTHFGYRKITVERPLRLNFQVSPERLARLDDEAGFRNLAVSKKKTGTVAKEKEEAEGRQEQERVREILKTLPESLFTSRDKFEAALEKVFAKAKVKLAAPVRKSILSALSERDSEADICLKPDGSPEPDPELRDTENVPLSEDIYAFFEREVKPHVKDAWIDESKRDPKDKKVGIVGYEINFNRYFYKYSPPRPLEDIEEEIREIEKDIVRMLADVTGSRVTG